MQLMTWPLARLGSRFSLLFEPGRRRVMHSALGRFFDRPLDLAVGLEEPDGTRRVLPFTQTGTTFYGCEQFERINSITFRGYSETSGIRFELNFHSPFYPQDEQLSILPAVYVELRVSPAPQVRRRRPGKPPEKVRLFVQMRRAKTQIEASPGQIDLQYETPLRPTYEPSAGGPSPQPGGEPNAPVARCVERIRSLNEGAEPVDTEDGAGLTLDLPVTEEGSGIKWRLVWAAHTRDPVLFDGEQCARPRYHRHWDNIEQVMEAAVQTRDDNLAHSRRFEKLLDQAPLDRAGWHLLTLAFQTFLSNTFWCEAEDGRELFSVWDGCFMRQNTVPVGYNTCLFYLTVWPRLLRLLLDRWTHTAREHEGSGGAWLAHDEGHGPQLAGEPGGHVPAPVESNCDFLLMLHAYAHWTGDSKAIEAHGPLVRQLADYLLWTDREGSGFPSEGTAEPTEAEAPVARFARRPTHLAVKRVSALDAAGDLLARGGDDGAAERCRAAAADAVPKLERSAWMNDHYALSLDSEAPAMLDDRGAQSTPGSPLAGAEEYSIHTTNGLLLPAMVGCPPPFDHERLGTDLLASLRETLRSYGCTHTSGQVYQLWISQNLWRDLIGRYLHAQLPPLVSRYWDLLVWANTGEQSFGYIDSYIADELGFSPRGAVAFGQLLAGPRLVVDRLDGPTFTVNPDRHRPQRWPLLPLADWEAGKIPVCVVDDQGRVAIEGAIEPVTIRGTPPNQQQEQRQPDTIG